VFDFTKSHAEMARLRAAAARATGDFAALVGLIEAAPMPMWFRGSDLTLQLVNQAYVDAVGAASAAEVVQGQIELLEPEDGRSPGDIARASLQNQDKSERIVAATIHGARRTLIMFLVDNHLTFWRTATTRNLDDPEVIAEFCSVMKTRSNLDALFLFTFADSNGTAPDAWNGWKESLMLQLHKAATHFLENGREKYSSKLDADRRALREEVISMMRDDYHPDIKRHFERMPASAFHFRQAAHIVTQVRTVRHFLQRESEKSDPHATCVKWIDHTEKGYTEMVLACRDKPLLLEKVCCALASEEINILSADFFTRNDGIVVNIFRVCTTNFEPVSAASTRKRFLETFESILPLESYEPEKYLRRRVNFLRQRPDHDLPVPVRAYVSNELHPSCTTVEIQALDRIGLLHDLLLTLNQHHLNTAHARICTEKGVAMDTLYITTRERGKVTDPALLEKLEEEFTALVSRPETPV
jgi:[protein-PII] uridylyltransferase